VRCVRTKYWFFSSIL